ncbi:MAG TPA: HD-GYP domain-containing protein [Syntrophomonadaceae bacterium]|nr:HD-GYP domain-containing protein [Syntrophomonadaceae bacterium]HPU48932.1 HD-GYP domain-containing protein [Syntrophomonadaceae bacterium]
MLRIKISNLKPGARLGKDIYSYDAQLLLPRGTVITQEHLHHFAARGIEEVFIMDSRPRPKSGKPFADVYVDSLQAVKSFMLEAKLGKSLDVEEIKTTTEMLFLQVFDEIDLFRQIRLMKEKDDYLFTHSVNVSLLCILIGRWMKCDEQVIRELGVAGLLHDIGKVYIDSEILNKPGQLTKEEYEEVKKHTTLGYNLIVQNGSFSHDVANAALLHHERADGSGYPIGTKGYNLPFYAAVTAVADVYDAITSDRAYSSRSSPYTAAEILWEESFGRLDPRITKVFYDKIANFYVGNQVRLSNNEIGVVIFVDPSMLTRPIVMVDDKFYNLATDRSIFIQEVID